MADRAAAAHLLRRATFGPTSAEVDAAAAATSLDAVISSLVAPTGTDSGAATNPAPQLGPDPGIGINAQSSEADKVAARQARHTQFQTTIDWWLARMVAAQHQFTEKLIFFWHGHWATGIQKVQSTPLMLRQLDTFRTYGHGPFAALIHAMLRDPALIVWLDGEQNTRQAPNENLARELMELFTLGIGNYTEDDVRQAARALTGWRIDQKAMTSTLVPSRHDAGIKKILGQTAKFDADSFAALLLAQHAHPIFIARRLWFRFASGAPIPGDTQDRMVAAYGPSRDITAMARALFADKNFPATRGQLVKQPVEWMVGALRQLELDPANMTPERRMSLTGTLQVLGQLPLQPPSVGGWPSGSSWLTTSSTLERMRLATTLANATGSNIISHLAAASEAEKLARLSRLLCIDKWTVRTTYALHEAVDDPHRLLSVALMSPEYCIT